jgi:hypothetical protein
MQEDLEQRRHLIGWDNSKNDCSLVLQIVLNQRVHISYDASFLP